MLSAQLSAYKESPKAKHKDRVSSFAEELSNTKDTKDLKQLISHQSKIIQSNNPYSFFTLNRNINEISRMALLTVIMRLFNSGINNF